MWTVDLRKVPHWLVTGATQSGKSTLLASWLTELGSQPVILVGIDLKGGMELGLYERRLSALAVDREEAIKVLTTVLSEVMERMADCRTAGVRSVWDLPEMTRPDPVVIIVDEVAELLLVASLNGRKEATECATLLLRIAQLGAALGVHLILAAQRFGSDLGPGATAIRAQMGGRVCHRVNDEQTAVMTLGDLAPDAVAVAQTITEDEKGVAVTAVEGQWRRVRSRWTTPSALRNHADLTNLPLTDAFLTPLRKEVLNMIDELAALPIVFVFGIVTFLIVRSREVNWWIALPIFLFGFYVAQTPAVFMIGEFMNWALARFVS